MNISAAAALVVATTIATGASAQEQPTANPLISSLMSCRGLTDDQARLGCYDRAAAALGDAAAAGSVVVIDREEVRRTRRALFGFSLPRLPFFRGDDSQEQEEASEIEGQIESARDAGHGKWTIVIEGGAVWQTTEGDTRMATPRAGQSVRIRRAALGSYMLSVERQRSVRAMRVR